MKNALATYISEGVIPPFVYTYPPRSAYVTAAELPRDWRIDEIWAQDFTHTPGRDLNLYIHIPFCAYKCGFCNLYTVAGNTSEHHDSYVKAICSQMETYLPVIQERTIKTVYIGGGTPTVLEQRHFDKIFATLEKIMPGWRSTVEEVCCEATPDSIARSSGRDNLKNLVRNGVTRINMGVQSLVDAELRKAGRTRASSDIVATAVEIAKNSGVVNLSCDLIMGFIGQTMENWLSSVEKLVELRPETISTYFLTVRPDAWFSRTGSYRYKRSPELYDKYDEARNIITRAGYIQESNVRYVVPGIGGYRQKTLHFSGVPVLGIGAGARTYTNTVDYVIGGSYRPHISQITDYIALIESDNWNIKSGFEYSDEERIRKRFALDLFNLDLSELEKYDLSRHGWIFEKLLADAIEQDLLQNLNNRFLMTPKGFKYRDILSWLFFSEDVIRRDEEFYKHIHERQRTRSQYEYQGLEI